MALYTWLATFSIKPNLPIECRPFGPQFSTNQPLEITVRANTEEEAKTLALNQLGFVNYPGDPSEEQGIAFDMGKPALIYNLVSVVKIK